MGSYNGYDGSPGRDLGMPFRPGGSLACREVHHRLTTRDYSDRWQGRSSMHVPPPAQATGGYDRHPRETGGDRAPGCEDIGLERASAGSVTIVPGMERKWVGFGRLLHDEVPGHLLGVDVATEEVGAGVIGRGKGIGGRRRTGDGVTYEDLLVRR